MRKIIAFCGLVCNDCPAFIATKENDLEKKKELAKLWADPGQNLSPDDITCFGCKTENQKKTKFCQVCAVRKCCKEKEIPNCAYCSDYPCQQYLQLIQKIDSPEAKKNLIICKKNMIISNFLTNCCNISY